MSPAFKWVTLTAVAATTACGQTPSRVDVVWDGVESFDQAVIANSMAAELRNNASAAGSSMRAVFLHPNNERPATATYAVTLPEVPAGDRLVLTYAAGLSDGVKLDDPANPMDGVGVGITIDGQSLTRTVIVQPGWVPLCFDLATYAGRELKLALVTDSGGQGNVSYDWALLGQPQVLLLRGNALGPNGRAAAPTGVLFVEYDGATADAAATLTPLGAGGKPLTEGAQRYLLTAGKGCLLAEFDLSRVAGVGAVQVAATGCRTSDLRVCAYHPSLSIDTLSADRGVVFAGAPYRVRVGLSNVGRGPFLPQDGLTLKLAAPSGATIPVPNLAPGEAKVVEWPASAAPAATRRELRVVATWREVDAVDAVSLDHRAQVTVHAAPPSPAELDRLAPEHGTTLGEALVRRGGDAAVALLDHGAGPMVFYARQVEGFVPVATSPAVAELELAGGAAELGTPEVTNLPDGWTLRYTVAGAPCHVEATIRLAPGADRVGVDLALSTTGELGLAALRGPRLLVGDGTSGEAKRQAIFPGLEYLEAGERSSSARDLAPPLNLRLVPDPYKICIPAMAVETKAATVALMWDPNQVWHGNRKLASAVFASPNFADGQANHLMQLFVPAGTDLVPENHLAAAEPFQLGPGETVRLSQAVWIEPGAAALDSIDAWCAMVGGVPAAQQPPRDFEAELALCRHGYLHSVWNDEQRKNSHCVGWDLVNAPQVAALLLMDSLATHDAAGAKQARDRANLIIATTLDEQGEAGLASNAACHIMRWNAPFLTGHLDGAWPAVKRQAYDAMSSMGADGSWRFHPAPDHAVLGESGAAELGTCVYAASTIWRYARLTGDPEAVSAGRKALAFMDQFVAPAGAQGWECPIHSPDILASAWAVRVYLDAYLTTGQRPYLDKAVYWAKTGLPFCYLWDDPALPGMRYASIPIFGATFMTHSWLGLPVQWCGLVHAYSLLQLAPYDDSFPWRQVAEGITVSGEYQQCGDEKPELKGCYPDSWGHFERKNAPFINPEDILLNRLALAGFDPEVQTAVVPVGGDRIHVSSGATITSASADGPTVRFTLSHHAGLTSYTMLPLIAAPTSVSLGGRPARMGNDIDAEGVDAAYDPAQAVLFLKVSHGEQPVEVSVGGARRGGPQPPPELARWRFDRDLAGWEGQNHCQLSREGDALVCVVTGEDPYFACPDASFQATAYPVLTVRAKSDDVRELAVFWGTEATPGPSQERHATLPLPADGQWHTLRFDLAGHPGWRGRIRGLRLDPEPADLPVGAKVAIRSVEAAAK